MDLANSLSSIGSRRKRLRSIRARQPDGAQQRFAAPVTAPSPQESDSGARESYTVRQRLPKSQSLGKLYRGNSHSLAFACLPKSRCAVQRGAALCGLDRSGRVRGLATTGCILSIHSR